MGYYPEDGILYYGKVAGQGGESSEAFTFWADASGWCFAKCIEHAPEPLKCFIIETSKHGEKPYRIVAKVWSRRNRWRHKGVSIYEGSPNAGKRKSPTFEEGPHGTVEVEQ